MYCHLRPVFLDWFSLQMILSIGLSVVLEVPHYYCVSFSSMLYLAYILRCPYVGCIYINGCFIFRSLDHYVASYFVSCSSLFWCLFFLIWGLLLQLSSECQFCMEYLFPSLLSVCICPRFSGSLFRQHTYRFDFLCQFTQSVSFWLTFKIIINIYVLTAILLIVWVCFFAFWGLFFFPFLFCFPLMDLMWLSLVFCVAYCVCVYCRILVCCCLEDLI